MIEAKNLMIGDWVCVMSSDGLDTHFFKITTILERGVNSKGFVEFEDIKPIPLTPEILDKNKFFQVGYPNNVYELDKRYYLDHYDAFKPKLWVLYFGNYMRGKVEDTRIKITYVHELQHALKLCGIEKEIVL